MQSQNRDSGKGLGGEVTAQEVSEESVDDTNNKATQTENKGNSVNTGEPFQLACRHEFRNFNEHKT